MCDIMLPHVVVPRHCGSGECCRQQPAQGTDGVIVTVIVRSTPHTLVHSAEPP